MNIEVRKITASETLSLRQTILRPGRPSEETIFVGDELNSTIHIGVFVNHTLATVATFMNQNYPEIETTQKSYRLRGMATDTNFQGQGLGTKALLYGIEELKKINVQFLWCHARQNAFRFYEALDFQFHGPLFEIPTTGPHKVMYKYLNNR